MGPVGERSSLCEGMDGVAPWRFHLTARPSPQGGGLLKSYEVTTGKERVSFRGHIGVVKGLAYSPDGKTLASGGTDRTLRTWDAATGEGADPQAARGPRHLRGVLA